MDIERVLDYKLPLGNGNQKAIKIDRYSYDTTPDSLNEQGFAFMNGMLPSQGSAS